MERPMIEVSTSSMHSQEIRGRSVVNLSQPAYEAEDDSTSTTDNLSDVNGNTATAQVNNLAGHPCAAGCGHICWAATWTPGSNSN
jgi:hypothetical protein